MRHPSTEQVLHLFSFAMRNKLTQGNKIIQTFDVELTDLQRRVLALLGVWQTAFVS